MYHYTVQGVHFMCITTQCRACTLYVSLHSAGCAPYMYHYTVQGVHPMHHFTV